MKTPESILREMIEENNKTKCALTGRWNEALEEALSRIEKERGWIPVSERLPEKKQMNRILAYDDGVRHGITTATFYEGNWLRDDNENICFFDFWMPLPLRPNQ